MFYAILEIVFFLLIQTSFSNKNSILSKICYKLFYQILILKMLTYLNTRIISLFLNLKVLRVSTVIVGDRWWEGPKRPPKLLNTSKYNVSFSEVMFKLSLPLKFNQIFIYAYLIILSNDYKLYIFCNKLIFIST